MTAATAQTPPGDTARAVVPRWRRVLRHPLTHLVLALTVIALVQAFAVKVYQVPTESMSPTLDPGDRILVDRIATTIGEPEVGDVVAFERPASWHDSPPPERPAWRTVVGWFGDLFGFGPSNGDVLVKRIIAGPGQTVSCCDDSGAVVVDGRALDETYVAFDLPFEHGALDCDTVPQSTRCVETITLAADEYLVLGDNRANSSDSLSRCRSGADTAADPRACVRTVPVDAIIGPVLYRFWPLGEAGVPE